MIPSPIPDRQVERAYAPFRTERPRGTAGCFSMVR